MDAKERELRVYRDGRGRCWFKEWMEGLDVGVRRRLDLRLLRMSMGNPGDHRILGAGLVELRADVGPGYRIYCAEDGPRLVLLLAGGDKATQASDIRLARALWGEYLRGRRA